MNTRFLWGSTLVLMLVLFGSCKKDPIDGGTFSSIDEEKAIVQANELGKTIFATGGMDIEKKVDTVFFDTIIVTKKCLTDRFGEETCVDETQTKKKYRYVLHTTESMKNAYDTLVRKFVVYATSDWFWSLKSKFETEYYKADKTFAFNGSVQILDRKKSVYAAMRELVVALQKFDSHHSNEGVQHPQQLIDRYFYGIILDAVRISSKEYMEEYLNKIIAPTMAATQKQVLPNEGKTFTLQRN